MNKKQQEALRNRLAGLVARAQHADADTRVAELAEDIVTGGCGMTSSVGEWCSREYIREQIHAFLESQRGQVVTAEAVAAWADELETPPPLVTAYIPLFGIHLKDGPLEMGDVVIREVEQDDRDQAKQHFEAVLAKSHPAADKGVEIVESLTEPFQRSFVGRTCAVVPVTAESRRLKDTANRRCGEVLDLLRFAIPALHHRGYRTAIGVDVGQRPTGVHQMFIVPTELRSRTSLGNASEIVGPLSDFEVDSATRKELDRLGVFRMATFCSQPVSARTQYGTTVLRAIHWFAQAQDQGQLDFELMCLNIAMESLFNRGSAAPNTYVIAECGAILIGDTRDQRKQVFKKIRDIYGLRSQLMHKGHTTVTSTDLDHFREIVGAIVLRCIDKLDEYTTMDDLFSWIDDQRFT